MQPVMIVDIVGACVGTALSHRYTELVVGMFFSQVRGPGSEDDFGRGCGQILLPALAEFQVTAAPWTDGYDFYLHGFYDENPTGLVAEAASRAGWTAETLFMRALRNPFNLPGGRTIDCEMPHNKHAIHAGEPYRICPIGHKITNNHQVANCPICSGVLK
ncbi:MAG: hypothetical protein JO345_14565 [Streptosporangiaceae bacterium]|nr:hypothetical protein [Streptosporangiaceae bacterium]